VKPIIIVMPIP